MVKGKVSRTVGSLGEYLKEQRVAASMSLRQLAEQAGVSNPYLSQIERGLRKPSADVLQQIAKALRISAEQVYVRAGILSPGEGGAGSVELAVLGDSRLTERQKQSLLDVYASFLALNGRVNDDANRTPEDLITEGTASERLVTEGTAPCDAPGGLITEGTAPEGLTSEGPLTEGTTEGEL